VNPKSPNAMERLLDKLTEVADRQLDSEECCRSMDELANVAGEETSVSMSIVVNVFDGQRECLLASRVRARVGRFEQGAVHMSRINITTVRE